MDFNINGLFEPGTEIYNITPKNPATHDILLSRNDLINIFQILKLIK